MTIAAAFAASAASPGGDDLSAYGPGRVAIRRSAVRPGPFLANLRFDFDGAPADASGTGTVRAYDGEGQWVVDEFPFQWTALRGPSFLADLGNQGFADFLAARIAEKTGKAATVSLEAATGRGRLSRDGSDLRMAVRGAGTVSIDGGTAQAFRLTIRLR